MCVQNYLNLTFFYYDRLRIKLENKRNFPVRSTYCTRLFRDFVQTEGIV